MIDKNLIYSDVCTFCSIIVAGHFIQNFEQQRIQIEQFLTLLQVERKEGEVPLNFSIVLYNLRCLFYDRAKVFEQVFHLGFEIFDSQLVE